MVLTAIAMIMAALYLALQLFYVYHWRKIPVIQNAAIRNTKDFSIIIVVRNGKATIENCIRSILHQENISDQTEIIVINDRSDDGTVGIIQNIRSEIVSLLHLHDHPEFIHAPAYKKSGIVLGISKAKNDWIIATDADCSHHPMWLRTITAAIEKKDSVFLAAPVLLEGDHSVLSGMQQSENLAFMLITAAGIRSGIHDMANGANMIFSKKAFEAVKGYEGNYQYSSGDDMFLVEKMRKKYPDGISFIKSNEAVVTTKAKETWHSFIKQRLRWAGKNKGLNNPRISVTWIFIGIYHVILLLKLLLAVFDMMGWWPFLVLLSVKWIADLVVLREAGLFFGRRINVMQFVPQQALYLVYLGYLGVMLMIRRKGDW